MLSIFAALATFSVAPLPAPQTSSLQGFAPGDGFGRALAACDVNADGHEDLLVGAPGFDARELEDAGCVGLYLGGPAGLSTSPDWTFHGRQAGAYLGKTLAAVGDVNGDGYPDVAVGAPGYDAFSRPKQFFVSRPPLPDAGRVWIFHGGPAGLAGPARVVQGIEPDELFGSALAAAGDVNGDGFDDVLVGAPGKSHGRGAGFVFAGSATGMEPRPLWYEVGEQLYDYFGATVSNAGDVDGDGFDDVLVGGPEVASPMGRGRALLYAGSPNGPLEPPLRDLYGTSFGVHGFGASMASAGDIDGDALDDVLISEPSRRKVHVFFSDGQVRSLDTRLSAGSGDGFGEALVVGDVDGDARRDLVVSAPFHNQDDFGTQEGVVFAFRGSSRGGHQQLFGNDGFLPTHRTYDSPSGEGEGWGASLAALDLNGDGAEAVAVGSPLEDGARGAVWLFPGKKSLEGFLEAPFSSFDVPTLTIEGDYDGNGHRDLVLMPTLDSLAVVYGPVSTPLLPAPAFDPVGNVVSQYDVADVDQDGFDDLLVVAQDNLTMFESGTSSAWVSLYMGSPGGLSTVPAFQSQGKARIEADANGDGFPDLFLMLDNASHVYFGSATGFAAAPDHVLGGSGWGSRLGDANGDGLTDFYEFRSPGVALSLPDFMDPFVFDRGAFTPLVGFSGEILGGAYPGNMYSFPWGFGDFDGDGDADHLRRRSVFEEDTSEGVVFVMLAEPDGWIQVDRLDGNYGFSEFGYGSHTGTCVVDLNEDGYDDFIARVDDDSYFPEVRIHLGCPEGLERVASLSFEGLQDDPEELPLVSVADLNGDGTLDVSIGYLDRINGGGATRIWLQQP